YYRNPLKTIRINSATLDNPTEAYTDIEVEKTYIHPNYNLSSQYDDIALLKLNKIAPGYARPAQLHNTTDIPSNILTATGWGRTDFAGPTSNDLLEVVLKTYTFSECSAFYRKNNRLANGLDDNTQLCAGGEGEEVKDTCNGDSGGPLSYKIEDTHYIAGITSFGKACGLVNVPAVYTRVSAYVPWIESIVQIK
ncbi:serine protease snk-like, partial [Rhynchophorus ferrugineus]|uniref:serine protease snk-like n=1 Tax=Rhynchophorus ferrugineus TaxID=354439 RepID=UPI003FCC7D04